MEIASLKNVSVREWIRAAERDGFHRRKTRGSHHLYQHTDGRRALLVYHNFHETFGPKTIRQILTSTEWNENDLKRLSLLT